MVSAAMTDSGKLFHVLTILAANEHNDVYDRLDL